MDIKESRDAVTESLQLYGGPGVGNEMEKFIKSCPQCLKTTPPPTEPLLQVPLPKHPWERVASDLFELRGITYLLVVDYYSRYVELQLPI